MPVTTRSMEAQFQKLFESIEEMKKGQEEMKKGQDEMKNEIASSKEETKCEIASSKEEMKDEIVSSREEMKKAQEEMRKCQEDINKIALNQEVLKEGQKEMKEELKIMIDEKFRDMEDRIGKVEDQYKELEEMKEKIEKIEEKVKDNIEVTVGQVMKERIGQTFEEAKKEIKDKVETLENTFKEQIEKKMKEISGLEKEVNEIKNKLVTSESNRTEFKCDAPSSRPTVKLSPYDGKTSWKTYKTQFSIVAEANGWDTKTKACQLAASLRGEAADVLESVPEKERQNFEILSEAIEMRFGESCSKDLSRLQLKSRQQKPNESFQEFAADVDRLSHLAFPDCPEDTRETLAIQYFIDGVRDSDAQRSLRMMDFKDLKSALSYARKFEAAQIATKRERHPVRTANTEPSDSAHEQLLSHIQELRKEINGIKTNITRSRGPCWECGQNGHLRRNCKTRQETPMRGVPNNQQQGN